MRKKWEIFIDAYFVHHFNATKAAIAAGYSARTAYSQGPRLLKKVEIREAVAERLHDLQVKADEVRVRLADHSRGSLDDFVNAAGTGLDLQRARAAGKLHLVKRMRTRTRRTGDGVETEVEIELYDAQAATVTLARMLNLFPSRLDIELDWKREMTDAGVNAEEVMDGLIQQFERHLTRSAGAAAGGSLDAGESAGESAEVEQPGVATAGQ